MFEVSVENHFLDALIKTFVNFIVHRNYQRCKRLPQNMEAFYKMQEYLSKPYLFFAFLSIPVGCLGIVGNILCMIVLSRPKMRHNSINLLLLCLAFWDIAAIIGVSGALGSYSTLLYLFTKDTPFLDHFSGQVKFQVVSFALGETGNSNFANCIFFLIQKKFKVTILAQHASSGLTLLITLERCIHGNF